MTTSSSFASDPPPIPGPGGQGHPHAPTHVLASALAHLLARDEERPARWLTRSFATEVEFFRMPLRRVVRARDLPEPDAAAPATFTAAVEALASDPAFVAVAIRRLEIARSAALPAWEDLVRRGIPPTPTPLDIATWFG